MSSAHKALALLGLAGLAALASSLSISAEGRPAAAPAAASGNAVATAMPIVAEHKYRMLAKVRPLLFWIAKDDVGGARISWRGDGDGVYGLDLLIGSDPQRAPRQVNRWGYLAEQVRGADSQVIGVMKQSNEQSVAEAEKQIGREGGQGHYVYRAIQGAATAEQARAGVTTVRVERDLTFRDIGPLLDMVAASGNEGSETRSVALPAGTRPGFLVGLRELVQQSTDAYARNPGGGFVPSKTPTSYVYFGVFYDLAMKSSKLLSSTTIDGQHYTNVARSDFEITNRSNGETTRFQLTYGTTGTLAGVPVHAVYQPRWWFEVQLFLDEHTSF